MESYTGFTPSLWYTFMDNVPYDEWVEYLHNLLIEWSKGWACLELGCGTGNVTRRLRI